MRKVFKGFSFLIILVVLVCLYFPGFSKYMKLRRQEEKLNQDIAELTLKIEELKKEERLIKTDVDHLEQVMRKELGLVKPGEVVYKLVPEEVKPAAKADQKIESENSSPEVALPQKIS